jgi:transposase
MGVAMRGDDGICGSLFSYMDLEKRVPADHPLRVIREIANPALKSLSGEFAKLYSPIGRESIPPERLMRAFLLQAFYSIRSERQLGERIDYDLLFRWFVGLGIEDAVWDATSGRSLARAAKAAGIERFEIGSVSLLGWSTNLLLIAVKAI